MNRNIRAEMARHDIKSEKLAQVLGMSTVTLSGRLTGKTPWWLHEAKMVVDFFNSLGGHHTIESLYFDKVAVRAD